MSWNICAEANGHNRTRPVEGTGKCEYLFAAKITTVVRPNQEIIWQVNEHYPLRIENKTR